MFDYKKIKKERSFEIIDQVVSKEEIKQLSAIKNVVGFVIKNSSITDEDVKELCKLSKLINITFENTHISDKALEYLSGLPKLTYLWIKKANITGEGFSHFETHKKIKCIYVCQTKVNDETLKCLAKIPNLSTLRIDDTAVTFEGLMSVANNPILKVLNKDFSKDQITEFKHAQRQLTKKKTKVNAIDISEGEKKLLSFFDAMTEWEKSTKGRFSKKTEESSIALFEKYCTPKNWSSRGNIAGGPAYSYATHKIIDVEQVSKNKLYFFTEDELDFQYRFTVLRKENEWRVDEAHYKFGRWKKAYL